MGKNSEIAVFDSGIGGISVLIELCRCLPRENFYYFADVQNAPYGDKKTAEIRTLMLENMQCFMQRDVKAVVIACNTATAAAAELLRENFPQIPILGIEPAIKPALKKTAGKVLVLATELTIHENKLHCLVESLHQEQRIILCPCPGLMELTEENPNSVSVKAYLQKTIEPLKAELSAIVLGCTHYSFFKQLLQNIYPQIAIFDGNIGLAKHLEEVLKENNLQADENGSLKWDSSLKNVAQRVAYQQKCEKFFALSDGLFCV